MIQAKNKSALAVTHAKADIKFMISEPGSVI
jgi:hypothetical protein